MNEDTTADLNRMLAEFEAGTLHPDDAGYIAALHARLTGARRRSRSRSEHRNPRCSTASTSRPGATARCGPRQNSRACNPAPPAET